MKKAFKNSILVFAALFLFLPLAAQSAISSVKVEQKVGAHVLYEHVTWAPVSRTGMYEVEVRTLTPTGMWQLFSAIRVDSASCDLTLEPGSWRIRVSSLNSLGVRSRTSDWVEVTIPEYMVPHLDRSSFPVHPEYKVNALVRGIEDQNGVENIRISGVNCFYEDSVFTFTPIASSPVDSLKFTASDLREEIHAPVVYRNPDEGFLEVAVNWKRLEPGWYMFSVQSWNGLSDSVPVLVLPEKALVIDTSRLAYDDYFQTAVLPLTGGADNSFTVGCSGVMPETVFSLVPADDSGKKPYPLAYSQKRGSVQLSSAFVENGEYSLTIQEGNLYTGYYYIHAESPNIPASDALILVTAEYAASLDPAITSVTTTYDEAKELLTFSLKDALPVFGKAGTEVYLLSESSMYGKVTRFDLDRKSSSRDGYTAVYETEALHIKPGIYALTVETADAQARVFVQLDTDRVLTVAGLTDEEITEKFLREPASGKGRYYQVQPVVELPAYSKKASWNDSYQHYYPTEISASTNVLTFTVDVAKAVPFTSTFTMNDEETLEILRKSEGFVFNTEVLDTDSLWSSWSMQLAWEDEAGELKTVDIALPTDKKELKQNIIIWEKYGIYGPGLQSVVYTLDAPRVSQISTQDILQITHARTYSSLDKPRILKSTKPVFFTDIGARIIFPVGQGSAMTLPERFTSQKTMNPSWFNFAGGYEFTIRALDFQYVSLNALWRIAPSYWLYGGELRFTYPNELVEPYAGVGYLTDFVETATMPLFAGVTLFDIVDIRYSFSFYSTKLSDSSYLNTREHAISAGINIPLRKRGLQW